MLDRLVTGLAENFPTPLSIRTNVVLTQLLKPICKDKADRNRPPIPRTMTFMRRRFNQRRGFQRSR